jgi:hypothetical protein
MFRRVLLFSILIVSILLNFFLFNKVFSTNLAQKRLSVAGIQLNTPALKITAKNIKCEFDKIPELDGINVNRVNEELYSQKQLPLKYKIENLFDLMTFTQASYQRDYALNTFPNTQLLQLSLFWLSDGPVVDRQYREARLGVLKILEIKKVEIATMSFNEFAQRYFCSQIQANNYFNAGNSERKHEGNGVLIKDYNLITPELSEDEVNKIYEDGIKTENKSYNYIRLLDLFKEFKQLDNEIKDEYVVNRRG